MESVEWCSTNGCCDTSVDQRLLYYMQDTYCLVHVIAQDAGLKSKDVFEYLYGGKELDRKSINRLKRFLHDKYAERDEEQLREHNEQD